MRKQKTAASAGALIDDAKKWHAIDWRYIRRQVKRLRVRIAKAVKEGRWNKVKALQYLLTRSFYAKLLAVKRVTSNKGKKTPGVDGVLWRGARAKWRAARSLRRRGYRPLPLRRMYIPKKHGRKRPLSIPTKYDRAMQALYKQALAPVAETKADRNSYGFREGRACADAMAAAFNALSKPNSATWVFEADITGCYDNISQRWMLVNIIRKHVGAPMPALIKKLNQSLRGWANYHRHVVASEAFGRIDHYVFEQLWRMLRRRHTKKSKGWLIKQYWTATGRKWVFSVRKRLARGQAKVYQVLRLRSMSIRRYVKIKADANPYVPEDAAYFWRRRHRKESKLLAGLSARIVRAQATA